MNPARILLAISICVGFCGISASARAFDFFGLFGEEETAKPSAQGVAYEVTFTGLDDDSGLEQNLRFCRKITVWRRMVSADELVYAASA
ncbi:MAG: hypothetical protein WBO09_19455 [Methylocystis silviterrae]|uniref:hypothetical protein n=1 Tax=Methylocystis silviterrae TaxID=2743612 RepID=UPI003C731A14